MKRTLLLLILTISLITLSSAHMDANTLNQTRAIIASNTTCDTLTQDQIADIGDYYMEQIHPGQMHDIMDAHMGGEGSASLRAAHIQMGEEFYCSRFETIAADENGWMPMDGAWGHGMWGSGMWGMGSMSLFGFVLWLGIIVLIILGIMYLLKQVVANKKVEPTPTNGDEDE